MANARFGGFHLTGQDELHSLLREAFLRYKENVIRQGWQYEIFVREFLDSHHDIDCWWAEALNSHRRNLGIMETLLRNRSDLMEHYAASDTLCADDIEEMLRLFHTGNPPSGSGLPSQKLSPRGLLNPSVTLSENELCLIAECVNEVHVFMEELQPSTLSALLECRLSSPLQAASTRKVAVFFDLLLVNGVIVDNWQQLLERSGSVLSSHKGTIISRTGYSSALSATRLHPKPAYDHMKVRMEAALARRTSL